MKIISMLLVGASKFFRVTIYFYCNKVIYSVCITLYSVVNVFC